MNLQQVILQSELEDERLLVLMGDGSGGEGVRSVCTPGLFCIWGSNRQEFIAFNLTKEELIEMFLAQAKNDITRKVLSTCHELQCGEKPYAQFTMTFAEAVRLGQQTHGVDNYEFQEKEEEG